jgi:hypothetical protein
MLTGMNVDSVNCSGMELNLHIQYDGEGKENAVLSFKRLEIHDFLLS